MEILCVYLVNWIVAGEFIEDTQYYDTIWFVMVDLPDGRTLCHNHSFMDRGRNTDGFGAAQRLAQRIEDYGSINEEFWYFHEFFSHSLESRLAIDAHHENLHRNNRASESHSFYYTEGHA